MITLAKSLSQRGILRPGSLSIPGKAIDLGWRPESRGKPFRIEAPKLEK